MRCSMSAAFKMWLLHLDNGLSCGGSARASARHGRSVQDVSFASGLGHGSPMGMPPFAQVECLFRAPGEQAASQANTAVLTSTEGMGGFSLPGAVRRFARAQIGLVSQVELVLWLGRVMEIRFLEAIGVVGEGKVDIDDGNFYCFTCWLVYHAARERLLQDATHVPPARNLQGVASAPESAQHERGVGDVSLTFGRRPQMQRPGACMEHQRPCTQIPT